MDEEALQDWLVAYKHCYERGDADRLVTLFTDGATYQEHPFMELVHARDFHRFWTDVIDNARDRSHRLPRVLRQRHGSCRELDGDSHPGCHG